MQPPGSFIRGQQSRKAQLGSPDFLSPPLGLWWRPEAVPHSSPSTGSLGKGRALEEGLPAGRSPRLKCRGGRKPPGAPRPREGLVPFPCDLTALYGPALGTAQSLWCEGGGWLGAASCQLPPPQKPLCSYPVLGQLWLGWVSVPSSDGKKAVRSEEGPLAPQLHGQEGLDKQVPAGPGGCCGPALRPREAGLHAGPGVAAWGLSWKMAVGCCRDRKDSLCPQASWTLFRESFSVWDTGLPTVLVLKCLSVTHACLLTSFFDTKLAPSW